MLGRLSEVMSTHTPERPFFAERWGPGPVASQWFGRSRASRSVRNRGGPGGSLNRHFCPGSNPADSERREGALGDADRLLEALLERRELGVGSGGVGVDERVLLGRERRKGGAVGVVGRVEAVHL